MKSLSEMLEEAEPESTGWNALKAADKQNWETKDTVDRASYEKLRSVAIELANEMLSVQDRIDACESFIADRDWISLSGAVNEMKIENCRGLSRAKDIIGGENER